MKRTASGRATRRGSGGSARRRPHDPGGIDPSRRNWTMAIHRDKEGLESTPEGSPPTREGKEARGAKSREGGKAETERGGEADAKKEEWRQVTMNASRPFAAAAGILFLTWASACSSVSSRVPSADEGLHCGTVKIQVLGRTFRTAFDIRYSIDAGQREGYCVPASDYSRSVPGTRSVELHRAPDVALGEREALSSTTVFKTARPIPRSSAPLGTPSLDAVGNGRPPREVEPGEYRLMLRYLPVSFSGAFVRTACIAWSEAFSLEETTRFVIEE